jgi:hypothetical protein
MTMISKIADRHLSRQACIYVRQSTLAQVRSNQESTDRQYNLLNKAQSLSATTVCTMSSSFSHTTVVPTGTVMVSGLKVKLSMEALVAAGKAVAA